MKSPWLISGLVLMGLSALVRTLAMAFPQLPMGFDRAHWLSQPWTWLTAALHTPNIGLWLSHMGALALLAFWGKSMAANGRDAVCWWLCWPLCVLALLCWPNLPAAAQGLGAMVHAGGGILLVRLSAQRSHPWVCAAATALFAFKLGLEHAWQTPQAFSADWGGAFWPALNLSGAAVGVGLAQWLLWRQPTEPSADSAS